MTRRERVAAYALQRFREEARKAPRGWQSQLSRELKSARTGKFFTTAHISNVLGGKKGIGDDFLDELARHWGLTRAGLEAAALGEEPPSSSRRGWDPPIEVFLRKISRDEGLPGLRAAIDASGGKWSVSTVARAVSTEWESAPDGAPRGGWAKLLEAIESGDIDRVTGDAASAIRRAKQQAGSRPIIPSAEEAEGAEEEEEQVESSPRPAPAKTHVAALKRPRRKKKTG